MVLSLEDLSLISISNGIKDGTIQNPHLLPPKLRQRVLDTVLKRGLINDPKCLAILSSVEFLNGMTSISTSAGSTYDGEFLRRLIKSMAVELSNGETVGAAITKLDLSVYGCFSDVTCLTGKRQMKRSSFPTVSQLIAQCPNVTSLALCGVGSIGPLREERIIYGYAVFQRPWFPCLFKVGACNRVMENLTELSVSNWIELLGSGRPIIVDFKQLRTLKLDNCKVHVDKWTELLRRLPTLEHLQMDDVDCIGGNERGLDCVLPVLMPQLKSLEIIGGRLIQLKCNNAFVDNLIGCSELRQVHLMLDEESTDEESMARLASMDIDFKIKTRLIIPGNDKAENAAVIDSSSHFKMVNVFHEKMESFELYVTKEWSPLLSTALEHVITTCSNLTSFHIFIPHYSISGREETISKEDMKRINAAMTRLFGTSERALQLKHLYFHGNFDEAVMSAIFENCLNLMKLKISDCHNLRDQHLIDWVSRHGGKLSHLALFKCENVTSEGIIPILAKSAERVLRIKVHPKLDQAGGRNWEAVLNNHCPNAQIGTFH